MRVSSKTVYPQIPNELDSISTVDGIYEKMSRVGYRELFREGFDYLTSERPTFVKTAYKAAGVAGVLFTSAFSTFSVLFGVLAFKDALHEIKEDGKAPIIGHTSEWTTLGAGSLLVGMKIPFQLKEVGRFVRNSTEFNEAIQNASSPEEREALYEEKLEFVKSFPETSLFTLPKIPNTPEIDFCEEGIPLGKLRLDAALDRNYRRIQERIFNISYITRLKQGWSVIKNPKYRYNIKVVKGTLSGAGIFLGAHLINYPFGIVWSAMRAYADYRHGIRPTIGGHSLEWFAELIGVCRAAKAILDEICTLGDSLSLEEIFDQERKIIEEQKPQFWSELCERLDAEKRSQKRQLKEGYLFSRPMW